MRFAEAAHRYVRRQDVDLPLVALVTIQRLLPVVVVVAYERHASVSVAAVLLAMLPILAVIAVARTSTVGPAVRGRVLTEVASRLAHHRASKVRGSDVDVTLERIWRGVFAREAMVAEIVPVVVGGAIAIGVAVVLIAALLGLHLVLVAGLAGVVGLVVRAPLSRANGRRVATLDAHYRVVAADLGHALRGIEDLQAHGLADRFATRIADGASSLAAVELNAAIGGEIALWLPATLAALLAVLALRFDADGRGLLADLAVISALAPAVIASARGATRWQRQHPAIASLDALLSEDEVAPTVTPSGGPDLAASLSSAIVSGPIIWESISFDYGNAAPIFEGMTLRWPTAAPLALVGANGSGKSTLLALLLRLVDPQAGRVAVGEIDLASVPDATFRARVAYVAQRPLLLEGMTVREAMALVAPDADVATLRAMLAEVGLLDRLHARSNDGDGALDIRCATLSVGEVQRVAIARALARRPELLVLDEPEAALDIEARAALRALLAKHAAAGVRVVLATQHADLVPDGAVVVRLPLLAGDHVAA